MILDKELARALRGEYERAASTLSLIASENHASETAMELQGSFLTDRAIEGYPGNRYFPACEWIDEIETLAIERAKALFGAEHANVQPHSGTNANLAVYHALIKPGDKIVAMDLGHGGHLSHGWKVSLSGSIYDCHTYGVRRDTEILDYDQVAEIAQRERPKLIIAGGSAYPRVVDFPRFREVADSVGALFMVDMAHFSGLVAGGCYPSPVPYADVVTGTMYKTMRGGRGGFILCRGKYRDAIDKAVFPGLQSAIMIAAVAGKAYSFGIAMSESYRAYARQVLANARALADTLGKGGVRLVSGGTDCHLMLADVRPLGITGVEAERRLYDVGLVCNRNRLPFDSSSARVCGGIRIGTNCVTSRGMRENEMGTIGKLIVGVLGSEQPANEIKREVRRLCELFPLRDDRVDLGAFLNSTEGRV